MNDITWLGSLERIQDPEGKVASTRNQTPTSRYQDEEYIMKQYDKMLKDHKKYASPSKITAVSIESYCGIY